MAAQIYIYRHAAVAFDNRTRLPASAFNAATELYNTASIAPFEPPQPVPQCDYIVTSNLRRSQDTARAIFGKIDVSDTVFREAELPNLPRWPFKAKPTTLFAVSRVLWLCGHTKNCETRDAFKARVSKSADLLERAAHDHASVGFIGHGFFNRYLIKALLMRGFASQDRPSHTHGTYSLLTKA